MSRMAQLSHDEQPVRSNQFLYKAILINTIILMSQDIIDPSTSQRIEMQLKQTLEKQILYCENDKNHPFLEEVVRLYASYLEGSGAYQVSLIMWSKFLRIQQSLLGEDNDQMIQTYKKMASLAVAIGQPQTSQKYLLIAQQLLVK